jgi:hypothetical protein
LPSHNALTLILLPSADIFLALLHFLLTPIMLCTQLFLSLLIKWRCVPISGYLLLMNRLVREDAEKKCLVL